MRQNHLNLFLIGSPITRRTITLSLFLCIFITIFVRSVPADPLGDPFDGNSLQNPGWKWQNEPAKWDLGATKDGWLHINAEVNQNLWDVDTVAKLYQEVSADEFDIATHLVIEYQGTNNLVAGLVIKSPKEGNWTMMKIWGRPAGNAILQWQHKQESVVAEVPGTSQPAGRVEYFIRMARNGDEYTGYWKKTEAEDWIEIIPHAKKKLTPPLEVGIFAGICSPAGTSAMQFEYFEDMENPFGAAVTSGGKLTTHWGSLKSE